MTRRVFVVALVLLILGLLASAPFIVQMRSPPSESEGDSETAATDEKAPGADRPTRGRTKSRRRRAEEYAEFRRYLDERRADGKPTTLRELLGPDPPDADNAAVELVAALQAVTADVGEDSTFPKIGPWREDPTVEQTPEQLAELRTFVERLRPFCDRLAAALDRPRCRLPIPETPDQVFPRVIQPLNRARSILAAVASGDADVERRLDALSTLLRLARRNEPTCNVTAIVNGGIAMNAVAAIRDGIEKNTLNAGVVRSRLDALLTIDWVATGPAFFELQFVGNLATARAWVDGELRIPSGPNELFTFETPSPEQLLEMLGVLEAATRLPSSPYRAYWDAAEAVDEQHRKNGTSMALGVHVRRLGKVDAACRLARVALAVAEYRAAHDDFPASLDDLKATFPEGVPVNPLTDAPFVYERSGTGVRIATESLNTDDPDIEEMRRDQRLVWELQR